MGFCVSVPSPYRAGSPHSIPLHSPSARGPGGHSVYGEQRTRSPSSLHLKASVLLCLPLPSPGLRQPSAQHSTEFLEMLKAVPEQISPQHPWE